MNNDYEPIYVKPSNNLDTRTASHMPSMEELDGLNKQHIGDVQNGMNYLAQLIQQAGNNHDYTKITNLQDEHNDFKKVYESDNTINFAELPWYNLHVNTERHHLTDHVPDDVNLIDVLERIVDHSMAGAGRGGGNDEVYPLGLDGDLLVRAVDNTKRLVDEQIIILNKKG